MKISLPILLMLALFTSVALSCSLLMSEDEAIQRNERADQMQSLQEGIQGIQEKITSSQGMDAEELFVLNGEMIEMGAQLDQLILDSKNDAEESGTPEWLLLAESLLLNLAGVRFMRGGASKGAFAKTRLVGNGSPPV